MGTLIFSTTRDSRIQVAHSFCYFAEMFQPNPEKILPKIIKAKVVPVWAIAAIVAAQIAMNITTEPNVHCELIVERPHVSTHLAEKLGINAVKLNITSKCNVSQRFTEVEAWIEIEESNVKSVAHNFGVVRANAMQSNAKEARFENLYVECRKNVLSNYKGFAKGTVTLVSGKEIPVHDDSSKFLDTKCRMGAK